MKLRKVSDNMKLVSVISARGKLDYYLVHRGISYFAFTKNYTTHCHNMCKSGIRVKDLMRKRSKDPGIMKLVATANRMVPYLIEYYEIEAA